MRQELPLLTPLRGFAALIVAYFHARLVLFPQWRDSISAHTQFLEVGFIWVDLFFILSGYVMMHVYHRSLSGSLQFSQWRRFMWLRFSRIYPLYVTTLLILVGWESVKYLTGITFYGGPLLHEWGFTGIPAFQGPFNHLSALPANLFLLQSLGNLSLSWNFPGWSLSVEWLCYMLFPLIIGLLPYGAKRNVWLPLLMLFVLYQMTLQVGTIDITSGPKALFRALCGFVTGMWLCQLSLPTWLKKLINHDSLLFGISAAIVYLLHLGPDLHLNIAVYLLFIALVLCAANQNPRKSWFIRLFDNRFTRFIGDISYSVYLWHAVILLVGVDALHHFYPAFVRWWYVQTTITALLGALGLFTVILIGLSTFSYRYLERPALRALRRWQWPATSADSNAPNSQTNAEDLSK